MGSPRTTVFSFFGALYPIYVRGLAYLAAHQGAEATVEFQKLLDHRGVVVSDPVGALAHLQLGRAFAMSGAQDKARTAYQDFLTLWKDADPDIPILVQAKPSIAICGGYLHSYLRRVDVSIQLLADSSNPGRSQPVNATSWSSSRVTPGGSGWGDDAGKPRTTVE